MSRRTFSKAQRSVSRTVRAIVRAVVRAVVRVMCVAVSCIATHTIAVAQSAPLTDRSIDGRVRRPMGARGDSTGMGPAVGAWVTVHRVAKAAAGPLDSVLDSGTLTGWVLCGRIRRVTNQVGVWER